MITILQKITSQLFDLRDGIVNNRDDEKNLEDKIRGEFSEFFKHYIDCCWLMTISNPRMMLCFDVVGKPHIGKRSEMFRKFSLDEKVFDAEKDVNTIVVVVWPAITADKYICKRGAVITVDKQTTVNKNLNVEET